MTGPVALRPMTDDERVAFRAAFVRAWADDLARLDDLDDAAALATATTRTDADLAAPGARLFTIVAGTRAVGSLWMSIDGNHGFLDEITIDAGARGQGHGRAAIALAEDLARAAGATRMELNVYQHNPRALALYEALGYVTTKRTMRRAL